MNENEIQRIERDTQLANLCRSNLLAFARAIDQRYLIPNHIAVIARALTRVTNGLCKRLIISTAPRHGKSRLVSNIFPAWYLGNHPTHQVIASSYGQRLSNTFGRNIRNVMASEFYSGIFPESKLSEDSKAKNELNTVAGGIYYAVGRGGGISGRGGNLCILDDILKDDREAESQAIRDGFKDWYRSTLLTRLEPDGAIIHIATRWHADDPIGFVLREFKDDEWETITLPALDETETIALWPERYPVERLLKIKAGLTPYFWNSLYQQRPSAREGNILKREWWKFYTTDPEKKFTKAGVPLIQAPKRYDKTIQSWDLSFKEGAGNSFVVGQVWGKLGPKNFLLYQYRRQIGFIDTLKAFSQVTTMFPMTFRKLIENKANGPAVIDALKSKIPGIVPVEPEGSKEERASAVSPIIESGCALLPDPDEQPWVLDFIDRNANFPKGEFDDETDSMSMALSDLNDSSTARLEKLLAD